MWIAYDRDEAGDKAAASLAEELMAMGIECFRVLFPKGMDANEYARKVTPAARSLEMALNKAQWLGKGKPPERIAVETIAAMPETEPAAKEETATSILSLAAEPPCPEPAPNVPLVSTAMDVPAEVKGEEIVITLGDRRYRVRGLRKNTSYAILRVNLLAGRGDGFHVDTLDLYAARQRAAFIKQAAVETGLKEEAIKHDLRHVLRKLEELQDQQIRKALEPKRADIAISDEDRAAALDLLKDSRLLERILEDFERCGMVGEETNKLVGYIAAVSRSLEAPLAVIVQSSSAAGKSSLMDAILAFVPEEQRMEYSAMTGQSLFYMGEQDLKHKVLAIVEEEGASRAAYALKLLQSEGALTIASTGKDPATGRLVTHQYRVEGPVMIFLTTTAIDLDEELLNRCLVLTVNEDREQTQRHPSPAARAADARRPARPRGARGDPEGASQCAAPVEAAVRGQSLRPRADVSGQPDAHAPRSWQVPDTDPRHRAAAPASAAGEDRGAWRPDDYLHRSHARRYRDGEPPGARSVGPLARRTAAADAPVCCSPSTKRLHANAQRLKMERADFRFSRRDVRAWSQWGNTVLKKHLGRLEDLEYLLAHRGGRGQSFVYELVFVRGDSPSKPQLPGLIDVYDLKKSPPDGEKSRPGRPQVAGVSRGGRPHETSMNIGPNGDFGRIRENSADTGIHQKPAVIVTAGAY